MPEWAVRLSGVNADAWAPLRLMEETRVCPQDETLWLRGHYEDNVPDRVTSLPGQHFLIRPDGQLVPRNRRVPDGYIPGGPWTPIGEWLRVELPPPRMASAGCERLPLRLVRTRNITEPTSLLTGMAGWRDFCQSASAVRLRALRFAAASDNRVLVVGMPLPAIRGTHLVVHDQLIVPAGFSWAPAVAPAVVHRSFEKPDGMILWLQTDHWEHIPHDAFVRATRAAVRATARGDDDD